mmetsp:Transcript_32114/g.93244  ORF Transcript_32114/g.93244 Transcript_32114/m.93244 type:complete len:311 (-) Transcript_32114:481-1413(-)
MGDFFDGCKRTLLTTCSFHFRPLALEQAGLLHLGSKCAVLVLRLERVPPQPPHLGVLVQATVGGRVPRGCGPWFGLQLGLEGKGLLFHVIQSALLLHGLAALGFLVQCRSTSCVAQAPLGPGALHGALRCLFLLHVLLRGGSIFGLPGHLGLLGALCLWLCARHGRLRRRQVSSISVGRGHEFILWRFRRWRRRREGKVFSHGFHAPARCHWRAHASIALGRVDRRRGGALAASHEGHQLAWYRRGRGWLRVLSIVELLAGRGHGRLPRSLVFLFALVQPWQLFHHGRRPGGLHGGEGLLQLRLLVVFFT